MKRDINGVVLLDKPVGISSNRVLQQVKRLFHAKKAGHTGSLDPLASGLLPICLGEATKFSHYFLTADKRYRVIAKLGERTDTSDADGEIVDVRAVPTLTLAQLETVLDVFRGPIEQIPTMYSALKYQGQPLYKYARKGITVERPARPIEIFELTVINVADDQLELEVHCSKGTYIRTLVDDIGEALGCGAHVTALRRLSVSYFKAQDMVTLEELSINPDAHLLPVMSLLREFPVVVLNEAQVQKIRFGQQIQISCPLQADQLVCMQTEAGELIGLGEVIDESGTIKAKRLCQV